MFGFVSKKELLRKEKENERIKKEESKKNKIKEIANYFIENNINISDVIEASQFIKNYKSEIKKFNNAIREANTNVFTHGNTFIEIGLGGLEILKNKAKTSKIDAIKEEFVDENTEIIQKYNGFLDLLPKQTANYCLKYGSDIIDEMNSIKQNNEKIKIEQEKILKEKQKEEDQLNKLHQKQNEENEKQLVKEERYRENEQKKKDQKIKDCATAIKKIEEYTLVFQKSISEKKRISLDHLNMFEEKLDIIEDLKSFIPESDINNIERCQKKMLASLARCENKDEIQIDIDLITESFNKILSQ